MEEQNIPQNINQSILKRPWYKTGAGITFLSIISSIIIIATVFAGMIGYYAWQLKYGNSEELVKQFATKSFTQDPGLATNGIGRLERKNIDEYVRQYNPVWGQGDKPITIVMFIDFDCPFCQSSYFTFKNIITKYEPLVKVIFKQLPLESLHPDAPLLAKASTCADEQGKFWEYYDALFLDTNHSQDNLINIASQMNLNLQTFSTCIDSSRYQNNINQDLMDAVELGLVGTPTYFVNGYKVEGGLTAEEWNQIILQVYNNPE